MVPIRQQRERDLREIKRKLKDWIDYLDHTWAFFEEDQEKLKSYIDSLKLDESNPSDRSKLNSLIEKYVYTYPHRHLSAVFIKVYVLFETELDSFNYWLKWFMQIELKDEVQSKAERNRDSFYLLKELLKKLNVSVNDIGPEYQRMHHFKKLRDNLSHQREGTILSDPNDEVFRKFLENTEGIVITSSMVVQEGFYHNYFLHSKSLIHNLRETIEQFYQKVFDLAYAERGDEL